MRWQFLVIFLGLIASTTQVHRSSCPIDLKKHTADELIANPPPQWEFECMNARLLDEALATKIHAQNTVECMEHMDRAANSPDNPDFQCAGRGYVIIAEEIFKRMGEGGRCTSCSIRLTALVQGAVKKMQKLYPRLLQRGLRIMG